MENIPTIAIINICDLPALLAIARTGINVLYTKKSTYPIDTQTAVTYVGASLERTMKLPAMPPRPFDAVTAAATVALFHWPTILFA